MSKALNAVRSKAGDAGKGHLEDNAKKKTTAAQGDDKVNAKAGVTTAARSASSSLTPGQKSHSQSPTRTSADVGKQATGKAAEKRDAPAPVCEGPRTSSKSPPLSPSRQDARSPSPAASPSKAPAAARASQRRRSSVAGQKDAADDTVARAPAKPVNKGKRVAGGYWDGALRAYKAHGKGVYSYDNGDVYTGQCKVCARARFRACACVCMQSCACSCVRLHSSVLRARR